MKKTSCIFCSGAFNILFNVYIIQEHMQCRCTGESRLTPAGQTRVRRLFGECFSIFQLLSLFLWCFILMFRCVSHGDSMTFMSPATWVNIGSRANACVCVLVMKCASLWMHAQMWVHSQGNCHTRTIPVWELGIKTLSGNDRRAHNVALCQNSIVTLRQQHSLQWNTALQSEDVTTKVPQWGVWKPKTQVEAK